jgi:CO/xanthine dehydrogenase Mo-binding subunit
MSTVATLNHSRRAFLGSAGALVVSFALPLPGMAAQDKAAHWPAKINPEALDSWLAVLPDGSVIASVGKIEAGMGVSTAFVQIIADELDVPMERVTLRMGDTATTVDQRGTGSSNGIIQGGSALRQAGAQARQALLQLASEKLAAPADRLRVENGTVSVIGEPGRTVSYGELVGGKRFEMKLDGKAKPKSASDYKLVGKPVPRMDIPLKVTGAYPYMVDFKLPGMLHGRVIRPPQAGAKLLGIVPGQRFPGLVKIVTQGDFVGVVCEREEQAIRAARELRIRWSTPEPMFSPSYDALYQTLRTATPHASKTGDNIGDVDAALANAARVIEQQYDYPFQSHACMGPACAVADVRAGQASVWMGGQKPYPLRKTVAEMLHLSPEQVRVSWLPGPGSYGANDADDAAIDAVLLSRAVQRPVRLQYMRADGTGWDPKGPPTTIRMRAGLDAEGRITAFAYDARGYSGRTRPSGTDSFGDSLAAQLIGGMKTASTDLFQFSDENYRFPNKRKTSALIPWEQSLTTGLRTAHLRDPDGMSTCFASECFIDELAVATGRDPVEFRLAHLSGERDKAVIRAAAQLADWEGRKARKQSGDKSVLKGTGIAYAPRSGTMVAIVADVEVNADSGAFRVTRFAVAHDCGFVINPRSLSGTIEANLMQGMSRAKHEAVRFNETQVTSVDWATYPIVDMTEIPDRVDIVLLNNRPEAKSTGAGEPTTRPVAAAIANALSDAIGVRIRRVPFTEEAVKAALAQRSV